MAIRLTKKELDFIERHRDLIDSKNYSGIFSLSQRDLQDIDFVGLKFCILISMLSGDKIKVECLPNTTVDWGIIFSFIGGAFDTINHLTNVPKDPCVRREWVKDYIESFLGSKFGMNYHQTTQVINLMEVV